MSKEQLGSLIEQLNAATKAERLAALTAIRKLVDSGDIPQPARGKDVNNHIHTFYSFSPYSPAKAVYRSWDAGLATTGIMDHDSISGAEEFIEAGRILGIATTVGAELRADFSGTLLEGRRVNNPDQNTVTYVAMHGIPHTVLGGLARQNIPPFSREEARQYLAEKLRGRPAAEHLEPILDGLPDYVPEFLRIAEPYLFSCKDANACRHALSNDILPAIRRAFLQQFDERLNKNYLPGELPTAHAILDRIAQADAAGAAGDDDDLVLGVHAVLLDGSFERAPVSGAPLPPAAAQVTWAVGMPPT